MPSAPSDNLLDFDTFCRLRDLICEKVGIFFDDHKVLFLERRIVERMAFLGLDTPHEYHFQLKFGDPNGRELQALTNLLATNETYMFREYEQLQSFADYCLPEVVASKHKRAEHRLRVWCAGCSSGEEAYTLAIILLEVLEAADSMTPEIVATDIDEHALQEAQRGLYSERSIKDAPQDYINRYLVREHGGYRVARPVRDLITFRHLNLRDRLEMRAMRDFDFVFCRNVLIYFDDAGRKGAVDHFYNSLKPGGFIYLGHSESIGRISNAFALRRMGNFLVYMKPERPL